MVKFRKKPVEIEAIQWNNSNEDELRTFSKNRFHFLEIDERTDDPDKNAAVFDELHSTWVLVAPYDWIIKGIKGEFYPCNPVVFAETYDPL
jgi:hypothetical protein